MTDLQNLIGRDLKTISKLIKNLPWLLCTTLPHRYFKSKIIIYLIVDIKNRKCLLYSTKGKIHSLSYKPPTSTLLYYCRSFQIPYYNYD